MPSLPSGTTNAAAAAGENPNEALTNCIFSQYAATFAGVSAGTAYAVWRRPPNGVGVMLVAGAAGSLLDLAYGWNVSCAPEVEQWRRHQARQERQQQQEQLEPEKDE